MFLIICCALAKNCLPANAQQNLSRDPANPAFSALVGRRPVFDALEMLFSHTGVSYRFASEGLRRQIDPKQMAAFQCETLQEGLREIFKEIDPQLTFHIEKGVYVLEADPIPRPPGSKVIVDGDVTISFRGGPFDEAVETLFSSQKASYRIAPDVTAWQEHVEYKAIGTTLDTGLKRILACVEGLTYRKEGNVYIIMRDADKGKRDSPDSSPAGKSEHKPADEVKTVYLRDLGPVLNNVSFTQTPAAEALTALMERTDSPYIFALPLVYTTVTVTLRQENVPLSLALLRVLRAAPFPPELRLLNANHIPINPALYLRKSGDIYSINKGWMEFPLPDAQRRYWFRLANVSLYDALRVLLGGTEYHPSLDPGWREIKISATGCGLSLEHTLGRLLTAATPPMKFDLSANQLIISPK